MKLTGVARRSLEEKALDEVNRKLHRLGALLGTHRIAGGLEDEIATARHELSRAMAVWRAGWGS